MNLYPTTEGTLIKLVLFLLWSTFAVKDKHNKPPTEACNDYKQVCDIGSCLVGKQMVGVLTSGEGGGPS